MAIHVPDVDDDGVRAANAREEDEEEGDSSSTDDHISRRWRGMHLLLVSCASAGRRVPIAPQLRAGFHMDGASMLDADDTTAAHRVSVQGVCALGRV